MVTAAAGSDAAVVLVDITKIAWRAATGAPVPLLHRPAATRCWPTAARAQHRVRGQQARRGRRSGGRLRAARGALLAFCRGGRHHRAGRHHPGQRAARRQRDAAAGCRLVRRPQPAAVARAPATTQERTAGELLQPVQYVARDEAEPGRDAKGAGHQPRVFWGRIAHGSVKAGDAVQVFPSGERAVVTEVRRAGSKVAASQAGNRPASCSTASSTSRAATGSPAPAACSRPSAFPPRWPAG